jgi:transcriptional regulator with XRE-family HTH domain
VSRIDNVTVDEAVGTLVHRVMWQAKVSQSEMARRLGLTKSGLGKKILGQRPWTVEELLAVATELRIDPKLLVPAVADPDDEGAAQEAPATGIGPVTCRLIDTDYLAA